MLCNQIERAHLDSRSKFDRLLSGLIVYYFIYVLILKIHTFYERQILPTSLKTNKLYHHL